MAPALTPAEAWQPLPAAQWDREAAAHLLRRAGWSATAGETSRATAGGLAPTLERLFPATPALQPAPELMVRLRADTPGLAEKISAAPAGERRRFQREARERSQQALQDFSLRWLQYAAEPDHAAFAKWVLFLGDVYVVASQKVKSAALVWAHSDLIARHAFGPAPALTKAVSRSPAMIEYLDLNQSRREAPNENFARELFELFLLGEGNYTEKDIREAARAFTGYRARFGEFRLARAQHDPGDKTIFNHTGRYGGDDVIALAYRQPAAAAFLPRQLAKFYLTDAPLPAELAGSLGDWWRDQNYGLRALALRFFGSRLFYAPEFRGNFIKSPVQFYLGALQDLDLDVTPLPRQTLNPLRQMGQMLWNPPNVRGWVGGRNWIDSATLAARRRLVASLFTPLNEARLNADDQAALTAARAAGRGRFSPDTARFAGLAGLDAAGAADRLIGNFLAVPVSPGFRESVRQFLNPGASDASLQLPRLSRATAVLMESPEYQLC